MRKHIRFQLSMAKRARDFAAAHPVADTGFATVFDRLNTAVTQADAIAMQQGSGTRDELAARSRRKSLGLNIRRLYLKRLVVIAKIAATSRPELDGKFVMPEFGLPTKEFLTAARTLLATAVEQQEFLVSLGLGESFIKDLTAALNELAGVTEVVHSGRSDHIGARANLENIVRTTGSDVIVLDTFYRAAFPETSDVLAAWRSARKVPGPFVHHHDVAPEPVPAPAPVAAPATGTT